MFLYLAGYGKSSSNNIITDEEYFKKLGSIGIKKLFTYKVFNNDKTIRLIKNFLEGNEMKIYLAGGESYFKACLESDSKTLLSYFYLNEKKEVQQYFNTNKNLFLDSGGFSAFTKGAEINIDEYIDFIKRYQSLITVYAQLDSIGNPVKTEYQLKYMESKGVNPLPVFHFGTDYKILKKLCDNYSYIALGGLVPYAKNKPLLKEHLSKCFAIGGKGKRFHGFGMTGVEILKTFPFYSVDSTSWLDGSIRAEIYKFISEKGVMKIIDTKDYKKADHKSIIFTDNNDKRWYARVINNALEWQKFEIYITDLWIKRGVVWND